MCSRALGARVSVGDARRPGGSGWGLWFPPHARPHAGAVLEPRAAVQWARSAHLRGLRQGERGRAGGGERRGEGSAGPGGRGGPGYRWARGQGAVKVWGQGTGVQGDLGLGRGRWARGLTAFLCC